MSNDDKGIIEDVNLRTGRIQRQIIHCDTEPVDGIWSGSSLKRRAGDDLGEEGATPSKRTATLTSNQLGKLADTSNQNVGTMFDGVSEESVPKSHDLLPVTAGGPVASSMMTRDASSSSSDYEYRGFLGRQPYIIRFLDIMCI